MPNSILRRRGNESSHQSFTGGTGEFTYVTDNKMVAIHDSSQIGGFLLLKLTANKRTLNANGILYSDSTTTTTTSTAFTWDGATLTVDGDLTFTGAQTIQTSTGQLDIKTAGAGKIVLTPFAASGLDIVLSTTGDFAVNTNQLYVDTSAGNVGIGTVAPGAPLEVNNPASILAQFIRPSAGPQIKLGADSTTNYAIWGYSLTTDYASLGTRSNIDTFVMKGGNVGIGTTSPQDKLDLGNSTAGAGITWGGTLGDARYNNIFSAYSNAGLVLAGGFKGNTAGDSYLSTYGSSIARAGIRLNPFGTNAGAIQFFTDAASTNVIGAAVTPSERMRIDSGGNVGIGTSTFGTNAVTVFSIANGTAPTTGPADTVQFYSSDNAVGNTIPSFFCEGTDVLATAQADSASSVRVRMRINGTVVVLLGI